MNIIVTEEFNSKKTAEILMGALEEGEKIHMAIEHIDRHVEPSIVFVGLEHEIDPFFMDYVNAKVIVTRSTGLDHIDLDYCKEHGIEVLSLRGEEMLKDIPATAELTMGMMINLMRHTSSSSKVVGNELKGKTLGIIGFGRIGKMVGKMADPFDMKIIAADKDVAVSNFNDREITTDPVEYALLNSDIVSLHITADESNRNFMDRAKFELMKDGSWFLNSARPWLVEPNGFKWALDNKLKGAWVDFKLDFEHEKLVTTPHLGGSTQESLEKTEEIMAYKLLNYVKNK